MKKPDWKAARALFPALKKYTFVNAAGGAPLARPVAAAGAAYYSEALAHGDAYWEQWLKRLEASRAALAGLIGAGPKQVAFTLNTSHGMSLVAGALKGRGTVLTMRDEFPSSTLAWLNAGFKVKFLEPEDRRYPLKNIEKALTPDIKILVTSYVQYRTGFRQDLAALGRLCRRRGIILVVNATQALGAMPVDVKKAGLDFMVFSCFKWTMAGYGAAGLYASRRWLGKIKFPEAGWRSVAVPERMDNQARVMKPEAGAVEAGCVHFPCIFALGAASRLLSDLGVENIQRRIFDLNDYLEAGLKALGLETATPLERACRSGITIVKAKDPARAVARLEKMGVMTAARGEGVRVSLHFYNNRADLDRLLAGLKALKGGPL
ncbi:MAG: aminotransferase class V-fold PLP-dependent enzyme [Elusimicrobiales bacterium]|nr:aminotransferase class V-fold PLP-dependent enzyme [Elusimicrobiales bacterium]